MNWVDREGSSTLWAEVNLTCTVIQDARHFTWFWQVCDEDGAKLAAGEGCLYRHEAKQAIAEALRKINAGEIGAKDATRERLEALRRF